MLAGNTLRPVPINRTGVTSAENAVIDDKSVSCRQGRTINMTRIFVTKEQTLCYDQVVQVFDNTLNTAMPIVQ